jgi:hypothetical protein
MEVFEQIIASLKKEDIRYYKLLSNLYETSKERIDIRLFDYTRNNIDNYNDANAYVYCYTENARNKNAFHRLKNRIINDIATSLLVQYIDKDSFLKIVQYLYLAKLYLEKGLAVIVKYFLKKAEKIAIDTEQYEMLDIIYSEYLKLSLIDLEIIPQEIINKRTVNSEKINELRKVDDILAVVNYELKITQNYSRKNKELNVEIEKLISSFNVSPQFRKSKRFNIKLYELVSKGLLQDEDFYNLEKYLTKTLKYFKAHQLFDKNTHSVKLQMLTYLANSFFKNKKHKKSLDIALVLHEEMKMYDSFLYEKYYFFYINIMVINYSILDKQKAIVLLEDLKESALMKKTGFYELFVYLNLSVLYFGLNEFGKSIKNLSKIYMLSGYKTADEDLKLRISIAELIVRVEKEDFDYALSRIKQIEREFSFNLNESENYAEKLMLKIIASLIRAVSLNNFNNIKTIINSDSIDSISENKGIINYYEWIEEYLKRNKI